MDWKGEGWTHRVCGPSRVGAGGPSMTDPRSGSRRQSPPEVAGGASVLCSPTPACHMGQEAIDVIQTACSPTLSARKADFHPHKGVLLRSPHYRGETWCLTPSCHPDPRTAFTFLTIWSHLSCLITPLIARPWQPTQLTKRTGIQQQMSPIVWRGSASSRSASACVAIIRGGAPRTKSCIVTGSPNETSCSRLQAYALILAALDT